MMKNLACLMALIFILALGGCAASPASSAADVSSPAPPVVSLSEPESEPVPPAPAPPGEADNSAGGEHLGPYDPYANLPAYSLIPIEQKSYQGEYTRLDFEDMPATDAETLVCDEFYGIAMGGQEGAIAALWLPGAMTSPEFFSPSHDPRSPGIEWIRIDRVEELDEAATLLAGSDDSDSLPFEIWHREHGAGLDYDEYVRQVYSQGARVVLCEYELRYTDEARARGPQLSDGARSEYWLLAPGEDGNLRLFANTRFFGNFDTPRYEHHIPAAMLAE